MDNLHGVFFRRNLSISLAVIVPVDMGKHVFRSDRSRARDHKGKKRDILRLPDVFVEPNPVGKVSRNAITSITDMYFIPQICPEIVFPVVMDLSAETPPGGSILGDDKITSKNQINAAPTQYAPQYAYRIRIERIIRIEKDNIFSHGFHQA